MLVEAFDPGRSFRIKMYGIDSQVWLADQRLPYNFDTMIVVLFSQTSGCDEIRIMIFVVPLVYSFLGLGMSDWGTGRIER